MMIYCATFLRCVGAMTETYNFNGNIVSILIRMKDQNLAQDLVHPYLGKSTRTYILKTIPEANLDTKS